MQRLSTLLVMASFVSFASAAEEKFELAQVLWPENGIGTGLFGRAVGFSADYVVVGAETVSDVRNYKHPNANKIGAAYIYKFNPTNNQYEAVNGNSKTTKRLEPVEDDRIMPGTFSSKLKIDTNGRIMLGAPYSYVAVDACDNFTNYTNQDPWNETEFLYIDENNRSFYREIGAIYIFDYNKTSGQWDQVDISIPHELLWLGGYGRSVAKSNNMDLIAGAYYNRLNPKITTKTIGEVFVTKWGENGLTQFEPIRPPTDYDDKETQRFGSKLDFIQQDKLFITSSSASEKKKNAVFLYRLKDNKWQQEKIISFKNTQGFTTIGDVSSVRSDGDNALIAMSALKGKNYSIVFLSDSSTEKTEPLQVIDFGEQSPSDFQFCSSLTTENVRHDFLAVIWMSDKFKQIIMYKMNADKKYEEIQVIEDPQSRYDGTEDLNYSDMGIMFGSDFSWEPTRCEKFIIGAMSKTGMGMQVKPLNYSRSYIFSLNTKSDGDGGGDTDESEGGGNKLGIIIGCTVAAVVVVVVVIVVIVVVVRKKKNDAKSISA